MDRSEVLATLAVDGMTVEVVDALHRADVRPILLKGATLAALLYPEGGRTYTDCDLLVSPGEVGAARRVIESLGFADTQHGYAPSERDPESATYVRDNDIVDLHWNLHLAGDPDATWRALQSERESFTLAGHRIDGLSVAARAMHVAMHAAQHGLEGPQRFGLGGQTGEDLRRALRTVGQESWTRARDLAREIGAADAFAYGLRLDEDGAVLADNLALANVTPDLWRHRSPFAVSRGGLTMHRIAAAPSAHEKVAVLFRSVIPSRARVRKVADSRVGRSSLIGAYAEFWFDAVRGVSPALRSAKALRDADRRVRDEAGVPTDL